jgi:hypothetical protein
MDIYVVGSEPAKDELRRRLERSHQWDLIVPFWDVGLVDA